MKYPQLTLLPLIIVAMGAVPLPSAQDRDRRLDASLLVQTIMRQARECLARGDCETAVYLLESQLPKINGNPAYLTLLEEAYRGHIKELRAQGKNAEAQKYAGRLAILDPGVTVATAVRPPLADRGEPPGLVVRAHGDDERRLNADQALTLADRAFLARRYREAAAYYQQASQADAALPQLSKERWAYCKLYAVTDQLNNPAPGGTDWARLESEVRSALELAPRLDCAHQLLRAIRERSGSARAPTPPRPAIQHHAQKQGGWAVAESANFRVFHTDRTLAERALEAAEQARSAALAKWFGEDAPDPWDAKCDIYLHPTGAAYSRATGVPSDSPGHSSIGAEQHDASRVHSRRIDLRADDPNMLRAVLPHETTHVALAGRFGRRPIPRWADEGMAVLAEPPDKVRGKLRDLLACHQEGRLFTAAQLMHLDDYPGPAHMKAFYSQSTALVDYLAGLKGPRAFAAFLQDAQHEGYELALRRHYGLQSLDELHQRWHRHIVAHPAAGTSTAARTGE
jgi:tetratricopeptide (TPR) repeat protein